MNIVRPPGELGWSSMILTAMEHSPTPRIITLTTDFGLADHYVGSMKGVILARCRTAQIVDITHQIPAFSIYAGAYALAQAAPCFPADTINVSVIDPGVGTERRAVAVKALGQIFISPDNGLLTLITRMDPSFEAHEITRTDLMRPNPSSTFHGRDIFAPVAAAVAEQNLVVADLGPAVTALQLLPDMEAREARPGLWHGRILSVDSFGNAITNFRADAAGRVASKPFELAGETFKISDFRPTFGAAEPALGFAYRGSSGFLEIGINQGNAARQFGISPGDRVILKLPAAPDRGTIE